MSVLITGAAAGLARGIAIGLARAGYPRLAITYRPGGTSPDETLAAVRAEGAEVSAFPIEFFGEEGTVAAALAAAVRESEPVVALVHAVGPMTIARFAKTRSEDYREMVDGNLRSGVLAAAAVLPGMRERGFGRLVFFGMNGSLATRPARGLSLHAAAKGGLVAFARALALEEARDGITVNVIEPGDIRDKRVDRAEARRRTASNPRGRPGSWEDIADAVRFLIAPESDFVNGAVLGVDGGLNEPYERNAPPS